jgi:hypothetical protein
MSPLFMRFAIQEAIKGEVTTKSWLDLVLDYVEGLREGRLDLAGDDMLRAAAFAAMEAIRETLVPQEIEREFLRGVLSKEADALAFMSAERAKKVDPSAVIEMLTTCGLLDENRSNHRLQFAYDPVAEYLAANSVVRATEGSAKGSFRAHILSNPGTPVARILASIENSRAAAEELTPDRRQSRF